MAKTRTSASWLQLLGEDAPESAFQALRDLAVANASGEERAAIEVETQRALVVRARLAERAQRARELSALHEITSQLTALRDLDRLLEDIAVRARELLGVDIAYLALRTDGEILTIRVAAGTMGTRMRGLVMTANEGIVGLVVTSGQPFWTAEYRNEPTIRHTDVADAAAEEEGLGGILGVPLRVREEVIGVLFAADRQVRGFDESEVALLSSLASHAAAAIDNARLYDSLRQAAEELEVANRDLRASVAAIDRAATLHEQLTGIVVRGGGVDEIVAALSNVLGDEVRFDLADDLGDDLRDAIVGGGRRAGHHTRVVEYAGQHVTVSPVVVGDDVLAWLRAGGDLMGNDADLRLLERAALVTALVLVRDRALQAAERRARHDLVAALLRGIGGAESLSRRAAAAGLRPGGAHVVAVLSRGDHGTSGVAGAGDAAVARFGGIAGEYEDDVVAILNTGDEDEVARWLRDHAAWGGMETAGVAAAARGLEHLGDAYAEARRCVTAARALGRVGEAIAPADLGIYRFLLGGDRVEVSTFVDRVLAPLLEADETRGSDLVATVETYLTNGRHHAATADALHIHANTLYQRLAKVADLLGDDWRDGDRALELQLALRLRRVASDLPA